MTWILLAVYLVTSLWAFRTIMQVWFKDFGGEWTGVWLAVLGLIPLAGPIIAVCVADWKIPTPKVAVPSWLLRIGGAK